MNGKEVKARVLRVKMPTDEIGFFNALVEGAGRLALARANRKGTEIVDLIASPDKFEDLVKFVESTKKHVRNLEVVGEVSLEEDSFKDF